MEIKRESPELTEARAAQERPADAKTYEPDARYSGGYVTFLGLGHPCVVIDSWGDEAQIRSIIDGQEYVIAKRELIDAEVNITVRGQ